MVSLPGLFIYRAYMLSQSNSDIHCTLEWIENYDFRIFIMPALDLGLENVGKRIYSKKKTKYLKN